MEQNRYLEIMDRAGLGYLAIKCEAIKGTDICVNDVFFKLLGLNETSRTQVNTQSDVLALFMGQFNVSDQNLIEQAILDKKDLDMVIKTTERFLNVKLSIGVSENSLLLQDVTSEQQAILENRSLRARLEKNKMAFQDTLDCVLDSIKDIFFYKDLEGVYLGCNKVFMEYTGFSRDEIIGKTDYELFPSEIADFYREQDRRMLTTGTVRRNEELLIYPDGRQMLVDMGKSPLMDRNYNCIGVIGVGRDITEVKKLTERIEREQQLFDRGPVAVFLWKLEENWPVEYVSDNVMEILGYNASDFCSGKILFASLIHTEDLPRIKEEVMMYLDQGVDHYEQSYRLLHRDGTYRWFLDYSVPEKNEDEQIERIRGYIFDQTKLKQMELELADERQKLLNILESTDVLAWEWYLSSNEIHYTGSVQALKEEAFNIGKTIQISAFLDRIHPDDLGRVKEILSQHLGDKNHYFECEYRIHFGNHEYSWWMTRGIVTQRDENNKPLMVCGTFSDVDVKKRAEESLKQSEKLSAIGQLAGGIAHDFNNQLMILRGFLDVINTSRLLPEEQIYFQKMDAVIQRSKHLIKQLLVFSKESKFQTQCVVLNELLKDLIGVMDHTLEKHIQIEAIFTTQDIRCMIDVGLLENALINLILNARDAMPKGGSLKIHLESEVITTPKKSLTSVLVPGEYAVIRIIDEGIGMDSSTMMHIFEPFYTTKATGTGVGLSTVYGTVKLHQGGLCVASKLNEGSEFTIYLSIIDLAITMSPKTTMTTPQTVKGIKVMIVDDEPLICEIMSAHLEKQGYIVYAFIDSREALSFYLEHFSDIQLVLLDVLMPGLNGYELLERMIDLNTEVMAIYLSGFSNDNLMPTFIFNHVKAFLEKPIRLKDLDERLARLDFGIKQN